MSDPTQPELDLDLHQRLLAADALAPLDLAERYLDSLCAYLRRKNPRLEEELIYDAASDAVMNYAKHPHSYKPELKSLFSFLKMSAEGDLLNKLAQQKRRIARMKLVSLEDVALGVPDGNINIEEEVIARQEVKSRLQLLKNQQAVTTNEQDERILELMQAKVRATAEYARILHIEHLPQAEQQAEVKRNKDRLRLRLKRLEEKERNSRLANHEDNGKSYEER